MSLIGRLWRAVRGVLGRGGRAPGTGPTDSAQANAGRGVHRGAGNELAVNTTRRPDTGPDPLDALLRNLRLESERVVRTELARNAAGGRQGGW